VLLGELRQEVAGQHGHVLGSAPERRQHQLHHLEPVIQVKPELAIAHGRLEVTIGGGHQAHVDGEGPLPAHPLELSLLDGAQQLHLGCQRQLAHLVQEESPPVRSLESAGLRLVRSGERAALVAEERALHQSVGERGAVHGHEGAAGA
jgi:hypothetical protein